MAEKVPATTDISTAKNPEFISFHYGNWDLNLTRGCRGSGHDISNASWCQSHLVGLWARPLLGRTSNKENRKTNFYDTIPPAPKKEGRLACLQARDPKADELQGVLLGKQYEAADTMLD